MISADFETRLIGPGQVAPPPVCLALWDGVAFALGHAGDGTLDASIEVMVEQAEAGENLLWHNAAFDLGVIARNRPHLALRVLNLAFEGRVHCTLIREKLLNLTGTGNIDFIELRPGVTEKAQYSLAALTLRYLGKDRSAEKKDEDSWRLNFSVLENVPSAEWPEDALAYVRDDVVDLPLIYQAQEEERRRVIETTGHDPFKTEDLRVAADLCLFLMTTRGMALDAQRFEEIRTALEGELDPSKFPDLFSSGVLRPAEPPRPHAKGHRDHREDCPNGGKGSACDCPVKMTAGTKESVNTKVLQALVIDLCESSGREVKRTDPTDRFPDGQVSTAAEVIEEIRHLHPALDQYADRQSLQKLVTTELPRMTWEGKPAPVVHACFDVLKRTGRTSSYATDKYPSFNGQNVSGERKGHNVRTAFVAREGRLLFSVDYNQMELVTAGQTCLSLFGRSRLADCINGGKDPHGYLGAQLALAMGDVAFCSQDADPDEAYAAFMALKAEEKYRAHWKRFRTFAKPTGLGYPGGLGAETFVRYAKATYSVEIDFPAAVRMKEVWLTLFDEFNDYFRWVNNEAIDPRNSRSGEVRYHYDTPLGMYRPNCDYCACCNGKALQSPGAEGALIGLILVQMACLSTDSGGILSPDEFGPVCEPLAFVHDEIIGEVRDDDLAGDRVREIERLMVQGMRVVTPDVLAGAEGCLMRRWDKAAEPVYSDGRLVPWSPTR